MANDSINREKELVLAPNEYAFVLDKTKGNVQVYVGPHKASLSATDSPVVFDEEDKKFEECLLERAIQNFAVAPEGWYIVLKNPAKNSNHPIARTNNDLIELEVGKKVMIPGPITFPLWPGQMAKIIEGHRLRSNQYLTVRIYDADEVNKNAEKIQFIHNGDPLSVVNGSLFIIKGTDASFYIPPTGIEVVPSVDEYDHISYVRDAVTLERLEYCILLEENGNKRYIIGPDVVFPSPTEVFIEDKGNRRFKAIELNDISGLYIKVIADYEEDDRKYKVGEELFITGKDQMIYFPRSEHAIIKYGDQSVHFAVAIPEGEARYVLNKNTGDIRLQRGPCMFLPDPRSEVIVKRVLDPKVSDLWFPGNEESRKYNESLSLLVDNLGYIEEPQLTSNTSVRYTSNINSVVDALSYTSQIPASKNIKGDKISRKEDFTKPRTITLNTKYDGAVTINVFTGYAIQVVNKNGDRKVIIGPSTYLLEYDEGLEVMELSTGNPKNTDNLLKTVYLRVANNKVADTIEVETKDYCRVRIKVSYSINFENDANKWFMSENYIKLLCDRMRSMIRCQIKRYTIEDFYANSIDIIRNIILNGDNTSREFSENDMVIYDVDVLDTVILDKNINEYLVNAQRDAMVQSLKLNSKRLQLEMTTEEELINRDLTKIKTESQLINNESQKQIIASSLEVDMSKIKNARAIIDEKAINNMNEVKASLEVNKVDLAQREQEEQQELTFKKAMLDLEKEELAAQVEAVVKQHGAVTPELIAALQAIGDKYLLERLSKDMAPLAILGGESIADVLNRLLANTDGASGFLAGLGTPALLQKLNLGKTE